MRKFLTGLLVEPLGDYDQGRSLWFLAGPLVFDSDYLPEPVVAPKGFVTDFASVPRVPLVYLLMNDIGQPAAVIHDYLYRYKAVSRELADKILLEALEDLGVGAWRRRAMWLAVRTFGWSAY